MAKRDPLTGAKVDTPKILDLGDFETRTVSNVGAECVIIDPRTGEESATVITVLGMEADEYLEYKDADEKAIQEQFLLVAAQASNKKRAFSTPKIASDDEKLIDRLVLLTKSWKNVWWKGVELTCTPENARRVYTDNVMVRTQVKRFIEDRTNFFPPASSPTLTQ